MSEITDIIREYVKKIAQMKKSFKDIIMYAGNPDAAEGCRLIIQEAKKQLKE